jgi:xanthine dehydrogenase accessory factor
MNVMPLPQRSWADDRAALRAVVEEEGCGLATIVGIEGSFSRRLGAQLAVHRDGHVTGSLADGCLERQLASEMQAGGERRVMRFGAGSPLIDFRLPCGSGLDIMVDPTPDRAACAAVLARLDAREEAWLDLPVPAGAGLLRQRGFVPALRLVLFGEGPELDAMAALARAAGVEAHPHGKDDPALALGRAPEGLAADCWTAILLLFHDHEWEQPILEWALSTPAAFIGAQGGRQAREERRARLASAGLAPVQIDRVKSPVGIVQHSREPVPLALSALAQVVGEYERLHPHA